MMTVTENIADGMPHQPMHYNNYAVNQSYPMPTYDYRHGNSWEKANYSPYNHQTSLFSTGGISSMNKFYNPSFNTIPNLNNTNPNFYRRHTESSLQSSSTSIYPLSTSSNPSANVPFNYSNHPSGLFFGWNNGSSLIRTHSASFNNYVGSTSYPAYSSIMSSSSQIAANDKSTVNPQTSQMTSNNAYSSFYNLIPPINFPLTSTLSISSQTTSQTSKNTNLPKKLKRPRLTAHMRSEILKLKASKPTIFAWEIQQNLLQNGICTAQTLPSTAVIQRALNKSLRDNATVKEEPKVNVNLSTAVLNKPSSSSLTICLSPAPSPSLSYGESTSECSICLGSYRSGQEVSILACSHEYHSSCIGEWMLKNRSCPMCRKDIHNQPQFVTLLI